MACLILPAQTASGTFFSPERHLQKLAGLLRLLAALFLDLLSLNLAGWNSGSLAGTTPAGRFHRIGACRPLLP